MVVQHTSAVGDSSKEARLSDAAYQRIQYPDAAENLNAFENYKVFLQHWDALSSVLRENFEVVKTRRETRVVALYGGQGVGKTMFANKMTQDLEGSIRELSRNGISPDQNNIWHRIAGGAGIRLNADLIAVATDASVVQKAENGAEWVKSAADFVRHNKNRVAIVIADNAERAYFCQGLLDISLLDFMKMKDSQVFIDVVAQRFVEACREKMQSTLFLMLTNDREFLENLKSAVDRQHVGLMTLMSFPEPSPSDRETIVRVNTNRLNQFSYWFCIDKAGPSEKLAVFKALESASSFREAFRATDNALNSPMRPGRPANKNLISLIAMHRGDEAPSWLADYATVDRIELEEGWLKSVVYKSNWAERSLADARECGLLESEWQLRIVTLGEPFVKSLLNGDNSWLNTCRELLNKLKTVHGAAVSITVRRQHSTSISNLLKKWPDVSSVDMTRFWSMGQTRSSEYETALKRILPGYDRVSVGFIECRPDLVVEKYSPCRVLSAGEPDTNKITQAIKREAHVFEFTAASEISADALSLYLKGKLGNYVRTTQEQ